MVCQARFFLCVHGAHAVAAERPITHKPSTRWLRAAVGLRTYTELSYHTTDYFIQKEERQGAQFKGRSRLVSAVARDFFFSGPARVPGGADCDIGYILLSWAFLHF